MQFRRVYCASLNVYNWSINFRKGDRFMFEVKKEEMSNKTFRLPISLIKRLENVAQQKGVSMNNLVRQCCEYALDHLKEVNDHND